ncbi:hypothetical protein GCM10029978_045470 [Actinoallomurus acanthiterrae]
MNSRIPDEEAEGKTEGRVLPLVIACACALAEHYFPVQTPSGESGTAIERVHYLLSGNYDAWSRYPRLSLEEQRRIGRMLRHRMNKLANAESLRTDLAHFTDDGRLCQYVFVGEETLAARHGMNPGRLADALLDELDHIRLESGGVTRPAEPGRYVTTLRIPVGQGESEPVEAHYTLAEHQAPLEKQPPLVRTAGLAEEVTLKLRPFLELNVTLDQDAGQTFRTENLTRLIEHLQTACAAPDGDAMQLRAGNLQVLQAPTGFGKTVMMRGLGSWAVQQDHPIALLVPQNINALELAYGIEQDLERLGFAGPGLVVPLMSPNSMIDEADKVLTRSTDHQFAQWINARLYYACALPATASADAQVDLWAPGHEPCTSLLPLREPPGRAGHGRRAASIRPRACPFRPGCGKYRLVEQACSAKVIVTTHANFYQGRLHIPVQLESGLVTENISVEELILRRCQIIVADEIDAFQSYVLGRAGRGLNLVRGNQIRHRPLLELDGQLIEAFGRAKPVLEENMRNTLMRTRHLAETYAGHLAHRSLGPSQRPDQRRTKKRRSELNKRWILPRRWDGWCASQLRALLAGDPAMATSQERPQEHDPAHRRIFESIFDRNTKIWTLPGHVRPVAEILRDVIDIDQTGGSFTHLRRRLDQELNDWVPNQRVRAEVVDRMLRRAFLEPLSRLLYRFVHNAQQLNLVGVKAARDIADVLGPFSAWRAIPHGPQGRLMFAFTEDVHPGQPHRTRLDVAAFGGDPHTYVVTLGQITALAHSGHPRIVLGMSATAYAPGAHRHHVHTEPTWWVRDEVDQAVRIEAEPIPDLDDEMIKISGLSGKDRVEATLRLGKRLWPRLRNELQTLQAASTHRVQDSILLATTSYESCRYLAQGLYEAGAPSGLIATAIRPGLGDDPADAQLDPVDLAWHEVPGDRLEFFSHLPKARILIAPLARAERGLNILAPQTNKSAIGSIWLAVRPIPMVDEPDELLAHVAAHALDDAAPSESPWEELARRKSVAGQYFEQIVTSERYFRSLPSRAKKAVAAEMIISMIQLVGRARRGGTPGRIKLVDYAFLDPQGRSGLPRLIRDLKADWDERGVLPLMQSLYGTTLDAFFSFADRHIPRESSC